MARQGSARQRVARLDKARAARLRILTSPLPGAFASTWHGSAWRGVALQREAREFAAGSDLWAFPGGNTNTARQGLATRGVARRGAAKRGQGEAARFPGAFASTRHGSAWRGVALQREAREFAVGSALWGFPGGNTNTARQGLAARGVARRGAATRGQGEAARFPGAFASTRPSKALHDMFWRCEARQGEGLPGRRLATVAPPVSPNRRGSGRNG